MQLGLDLGLYLGLGLGLDRKYFTKDWQTQHDVTARACPGDTGLAKLWCQLMTLLLPYCYKIRGTCLHWIFLASCGDSRMHMQMTNYLESSSIQGGSTRINGD